MSQVEFIGPNMLCPKTTIDHWKAVAPQKPWNGVEENVQSFVTCFFVAAGFVVVAKCWLV